METVIAQLISSSGWQSHTAPVIQGLAAERWLERGRAPEPRRVPRAGGAGQGFGRELRQASRTHHYSVPATSTPDC